jgi:putative ABC transport system ATP-binding protein
MKTIIQTKKITKIYQIGTVAVHAVRGIDLMIQTGEFVAIMGASGSGKSTLMNILGCLDEPTAGSYLLEDQDINSLSRIRRADIRNQKIGFVFQGFNLLSRTTAIDNVELPLVYDRAGRIQNTQKAAADALSRVGLSDRLNHEPNQLSGGQQQRVAIARALVNRPTIIFADEPTGNLDSRTSLEIIALFQDLNDQGITILLVTHEHDLAMYTKRVVELKDGRIFRDEIIRDRRDAAEDMASLPENETEENANGREAA